MFLIYIETKECFLKAFTKEQRWVFRLCLCLIERGNFAHVFLVEGQNQDGSLLKFCGYFNQVQNWNLQYMSAAMSGQYEKSGSCDNYVNLTVKSDAVYSTRIDICWPIKKWEFHSSIRVLLRVILKVCNVFSVLTFLGIWNTDQNWHLKELPIRKTAA